MSILTGLPGGMPVAPTMIREVGQMLAWNGIGNFADRVSYPLFKAIGFSISEAECIIRTPWQIPRTVVEPAQRYIVQRLEARQPLGVVLAYDNPEGDFGDTYLTLCWPSDKDAIEAFSTLSAWMKEGGA